MAGPGRPKTGGREKGTPNRLTAGLRRAMEKSFKNNGGVEYLDKLARDEPRTYAMLLAKFIPAQIQAEIEPGDVTIQVISGIDADPPGTHAK